MHPLLDVDRIDDDIEPYLQHLGEVFVVHRGHDSGNISYGVRIGTQRWFVKHTARPEALPHLESAQRFHAAVKHPAIVPLVGSVRTASGLAIIHPWVDGDILNDPLAPGSLPRNHPDSAHSRFRGLPVKEIVEAMATIIDAHVAVTANGFVAVDFYDGSIIYDFDRRETHLCDLDSYQPGPYVLDRDRQFGSTRFMAPEEWQRGATIDERTTVFTLGRCASVFLSTGEHWRASQALHEVAHIAAQPDPRERYASVSALRTAWRAAAVR